MLFFISIFSCTVIEIVFPIKIHQTKMSQAMSMSLHWNKMKKKLRKIANNNNEFFVIFTHTPKHTHILALYLFLVECQFHVLVRMNFWWHYCVKHIYFFSSNKLFWVSYFPVIVTLKKQWHRILCPSELVKTTERERCHANSILLIWHRRRFCRADTLWYLLSNFVISISKQKFKSLFFL